MIFQTWKIPTLNFVTSRLFQDLYEPCDKADTTCTSTATDWTFEIQVHVWCGCVISRWRSTPFGLPHCIYNFIISHQTSCLYLLSFAIFHGSQNDAFHTSLLFVNMPFKKYRILIKHLYLLSLDILHRSGWKSWNELRLWRKLKSLDTLVDKRPGSSKSLTARTAENVILLVTSCSVSKVHHKYASQYLKFQGILKFVSRQWLHHSCMFSEQPAIG